MGKKKKKSFKVWCFYCEREFEDEKILIQHQKAKHFKCHVCHKKLSTAGGMVVHVLQVHKESITNYHRNSWRKSKVEWFNALVFERPQLGLQRNAASKSNQQRVIEKPDGYLGDSICEVGIRTFDRVPNAKPERESAELEIFGMEGIPPEILAAHDGDQVDDDEKPAKVLRAGISTSSMFGAAVTGSSAHVQPQQIFSTIPSLYMTPTVGPHVPTWLPTPSRQEWSSTGSGHQPTLPPRPVPSSQPLFPIHASQLSTISSEPSSTPAKPLFPIRPRAVSSSPPKPPLDPVKEAFSGLHSATLPAVDCSCYPAMLSKGPGDVVEGLIATRSLDEGQSRPLSPAVMGRSIIPFTVSNVATAVATHMYASAPSTGGPSIGPPPVISNKPPYPLGIVNEVYLVWDDEVLSMEERRLSLPKYQVLDETLQMNSIDAAFDRRIMEGRLAGRMGFRV